MILSQSLSDILFGVCYILILNRSGISVNNITFLIALMGFLGFIFDFPSGNFADKIGRKKSTAIGFITWAIGTGIFYFSINLYSFILSVVFCSLGLALYSGSPQAWIVQSLKDNGNEDKKNKVFYKASTISMIFRFLGAVLGSILVRFSLKLPILFITILLGFSGIITLFISDDNYGESLAPSFINDVVYTAKDFIKNKDMRVVIVFRIMSTLPFIIFIVCWQLYLTENLKINEYYIGVLLAIFMLSQSLSGMFLVKRESEKPYKDVVLGIIISLIGMLVINISLFFYDLMIKFIFFIVGVLVYEFGLGVEQNAAGAWIQDYIPDNKRASFFSAVTAIVSLFAFISTNIVGYVIKFKGYSFAFNIALFVYVIYILYAKCCKFSD